MKSGKKERRKDVIEPSPSTAPDLPFLISCFIIAQLAVITANTFS